MSKAKIVEFHSKQTICFKCKNYFYSKTVSERKRLKSHIIRYYFVYKVFSVIFNTLKYINKKKI